MAVPLTSVHFVRTRAATIASGRPDNRLGSGRGERSPLSRRPFRRGMTTAPAVRQTAVELGGMATRVLEVDGSDPPILLLHGFSDSSDGWRPVLFELGRRGRRAVATDLPGAGWAQPMSRPALRCGLDVCVARARPARLRRPWDDLRALDEEGRDPLDIAGIRVPVLLIRVEFDHLTPVGAARRVLDAVPESRLAVLPDCGHCPQLQRPVEGRTPRVVRRTIHRP